MRRLLSLLLLLFFCAAIGQGLYFLKKGFSPRRVYSLAQGISAQWSEEVGRALAQPFHYLSRGRQCFAFVSEDGRYVLKLPRTDIYQIPFWVRVLPLFSYRALLQSQLQEHKKFLIDSIQIASEELSEQTALLATHLGQSPAKGQKLTLIDALGCKHHFPLEITPFILQYRHPLLIEALQTAMQQKKLPEAEKILDALLATLVERGRKGILNRDRGFLHNYGFDGKKVYQIDIGSFFRLEGLAKKSAFEKSVCDSIDPVREWLTQTYPEMVPLFNQKCTLALNITP